MNTTVREQAETKVAAMAAKLTDEALCIAWMATEGKAVTQELAITRGWMTDELHKRLGDDLFDEWLMTFDEDGNGLDPLAFFERKAVAAKGYTPCWNCTQPATHTLTREGSITLHACDNCTRIDRAEAESRGWTITAIAHAAEANAKTENEEPTMTETFEPVDFSDVHVGDRVQFVTANNGFGGGDQVWRTGKVTRVTDRTVTVDCDSSLLGRAARLRRADWHYRCVSKAITEQPARRPYNAENVQYVDEGNFITAVWCSDPSIDPKTALDNILRSFMEEVPYEVVQIAEATRHFKREGAGFSGWIISRGNDYSTEPIKRKSDAVKQLHLWVEGHFTR